MVILAWIFFTVAFCSSLLGSAYIVKNDLPRAQCQYTHSTFMLLMAIFFKLMA